MKISITLVSVIALTVCHSFAKDAPLIQPGDALAFDFSIKHDDVDGIYFVQPDGYINLPFLGRIRAEGADLAALQDAIQNKYIKDGIYNRLKLTLTKTSISPAKNIPAENPSHFNQGDFYTPQEKIEFPGIDSPTVKNAK